MVLERVGGFVGSPLTLTRLQTAPFEGTAGVDSAFIPMDGEHSGGDEE